jgi:hypothetical protein
MTVYSSHVKLVNKRAEVHFGNRSLTVAGLDAEDCSLCCPTELMVGALGS